MRFLILVVSLYPTDTHCKLLHTIIACSWFLLGSCLLKYDSGIVRSFKGLHLLASASHCMSCRFVHKLLCLGYALIWCVWWTQRDSPRLNSFYTFTALAAGWVTPSSLILWAVQALHDCTLEINRITIISITKTTTQFKSEGMSLIFMFNLIF